MSPRTLLFPLGLTLCIALLAPVCQAGDKSPETKTRTIPYTRITPSDYQNFITNWDDKKDAVLCAVIQTPVQYSAVFHPAPVMGSKRPSGPDANLFDTSQILVAARVMPAASDSEHAFEVERVIAKGTELMLWYRYNEPQGKASSTLKSYLSIQIARRDYRSVIIVENGKPVCELDLTEGRWSIPPLSADTAKTSAK